MSFTRLVLVLDARPFQLATITSEEHRARRRNDRRGIGHRSDALGQQRRATGVGGSDRHTEFSEGSQAAASASGVKPSAPSTSADQMSV